MIEGLEAVAQRNPLNPVHLLPP